MTAIRSGGKVYGLFTLSEHHLRMPDCIRLKFGGMAMVMGLALAIFLSLLAWGASYFGWSDPEGKVQVALFTSFVLGALCGYKSRV